MVKIEASPTPLYSLTKEELARLTQGIALDLGPREGARARFHSIAEAERVKAYIA